jgi:hypothetical protein
MKLGVSTVSGLLTLAVFIAAMTACGVEGPARGEHDADSATTGQSAGSGVGGSRVGAGAGGGRDVGGAAAGTPIPSANVDWQTWGEQQARSHPSWGNALTDIANHLPASYGTTYDDPDVVTFGHETSHGIHAHLRNYQNNTGKKANAFYVLGDQAAVVVEPNISKSAMQPYVPSSLRDFRYSTYVSGAQAWDDTPLYIWDEWNAYVNGAEVGVNRVLEDKWNEGWRDQSGNLEFVVYALCLAHAVSELDPTYFHDYAQFREFLMWNTERAMALFDQHQAMPEFQSDDVAAYHQTLKQSPDAEELRQFVRATFGAPWAQAVLGF